MQTHRRSLSDASSAQPGCVRKTGCSFKKHPRDLSTLLCVLSPQAHRVKLSTRAGALNKRYTPASKDPLH